MVDPSRGIVAVLRAMIESAHEVAAWSETEEGAEEMRRAYPVQEPASTLEGSASTR